MLISMVSIGLFALPVHGQETTYIYSGGPFFSFIGPTGDSYSNHISVVMTLLNPLPPSLNAYGILPQSWTMTDGTHTFYGGANGVSNARTPQFDIFTDLSGDIAAWSFFVTARSGSPWLETGGLAGNINSGAPNNWDDYYGFNVPVFGQASGYSGSWQIGPNPPSHASPGKTNGDPNDIIGEPQVSEPINVATGNVYDSITDYETTGADKLSFTRYYNSLNAGNSTAPTFASSLGVNWRCNYDSYINSITTSSTVLERPDGQELTFSWNGEKWCSDSDISYQLTQSGSNWTVTDINGTIETYIQIRPQSTESVLTSIRNRNGYTQTLTYNANDQLATVTDSYNRFLTFTYTSGLLQTVTTPDGLILTYGYASSGLTPGVDDQLTSVGYSTSPQTSQSYLYENTSLPFALTGVIDEDGNRYLSWTYDQYGRGLTSQFGNGANLTTIAYNDTDGSRNVTGPLGQQEVYKFTTLQGIPKVTEIDRIATATTSAAKETSSYDANGYLASQTDWNGNLTTYTNDALGRPTAITEASGTALARTTTESYFGGLNLPTQIIAPLVTSTFTYDTSGNLLTKTLTDATTTTVPYATKGQSRTWTYTWANGLLTSVRNPRTDATSLTSFSYDSSGTLVKTTNALGQIVQVTSHTPGGLPLTVLDANGVTTQFTYDARQRLISSALSTTGGILTTRYVYDPAGNLLTVILPDGSATTSSYDTAHRLIGTTDLLGQTVAYTLDAQGNRTVTTIANAAKLVQSHHASSYDALGRLLLDTGGVGQQTAFTYDANGNTLTITDPLSHTTTQTFDALNRLTASTDSTGGITTTAYDTQDHPKTVTPPNNGKTIYTYDGFGEVIETSSPDTHNTVYLYDADGNVSEKLDATRAIVNYSYDALDRVTAAVFPADAPENVAYTYDQAGYGFGIGRLTSLKDAVGTLTKTYDERGNLLSDTRHIGSAVLATDCGYDAASRIASITYSSGAAVSYSRDVMGRTTAVNILAPGSEIAQNVVSNISYEPLGPITSVLYGNGITETRGFDADYRMTGIADTGTTALQSLGYSYDAADNVKSITDGVTPGNSQNLVYDTLNRLTQATGVYGALAYSYDHMGNRLTQGIGSAVTTYTYTPASNQLAAVSAGGTSQTVSYTLAGNISALSTGPVSTLTYNQTGRLATVKSGSQTVAQYGYDAFGQRLTKSLSSGSALYQYDQQGHLLEETNTNGTPLADYIYLDGGRLIAVLSPSKGLNFVLDDRLGTPQLATNQSQAIIWSADYQPFGVTNASGSIVQNLRLPGQYADAETGWSQNGFRDYVPGIGRYLESDPIGLGGGLNTYAYVGGNPLKSVDPMGQDWSQRFQQGFQVAQPIDSTLSSGVLLGQSLLTVGRTLGEAWLVDANISNASYLSSSGIIGQAAAEARISAQELIGAGMLGLNVSDIWDVTSKTVGFVPTTISATIYAGGTSEDFQNWVLDSQLGRAFFANVLGLDYSPTYTTATRCCNSQ